MAKSRTRRGSPLHITPSFDLFAKSKNLVMANLGLLWPFFAFQLLFLINNWITNPNSLHGRNKAGYDVTSHSAGWSSPTFPNYTWSLFLGIGFFAVVWIIISVIIEIMLLRAQLDIAQSNATNFSRLWAAVKEYGWRMVGLFIVVALYIIVGFILLIVPGIIMIRRYFLAPYVMLDQNLGIKEAMERSAAMSKPYSGYIWGVIGVGILISLLNIIPFIGSLLAFAGGALYSLAPALRYQELKKLHANG